MPFVDEDCFLYGKQAAEVYIATVRSFADRFPVCDLERNLRCCRCNKDCSETRHLLTRASEDKNTLKCCKSSASLFDSSPVYQDCVPDPERRDGSAVCMDCLWNAYLMPVSSDLRFLKTWFYFDECIGASTGDDCVSRSWDMCSAMVDGDPCETPSQNRQRLCCFEFSLVTDDPASVLTARANQMIHVQAPNYPLACDHPDLFEYASGCHSAQSDDIDRTIQTTVATLFGTLQDERAQVRSVVHDLQPEVDTQNFHETTPEHQEIATPQQDHCSEQLLGLDHGSEELRRLLCMVEQQFTDDKPLPHNFVTSLAKFSGNKMSLCRTCGSLGHDNLRACTVFHTRLMPKVDSDYTKHHVHFLNQNHEYAETEARKLIEQFKLLVRAAIHFEDTAHERNPSAPISRNVFNADGKLLDRQLSESKKLFKKKPNSPGSSKKEKTVPPDGTEYHYNRIRSEYQFSMGCRLTAWFGAPLTYLHDILQRGQQPSTLLDMSSFTTPSEMDAMIETWRQLNYDVTDMQRLRWIVITDLDGDNGPFPSPAKQMKYYEDIIQRETNQSGDLSDYGKDAVRERAMFFDSVIDCFIRTFDDENALYKVGNLMIEYYNTCCLQNNTNNNSGPNETIEQPHAVPVCAPTIQNFTDRAQQQHEQEQQQERPEEIQLHPDQQDDSNQDAGFVPQFFDDLDFCVPPFGESTYLS